MDAWINHLPAEVLPDESRVITSSVLGVEYYSQLINKEPH